MKRLLAGIFALLMTLTGATAAYADPVGTYERRCSGFQRVAPDIEVNTCTVFATREWGAKWDYQPFMDIRNTSTIHPVYAHADLLIDGAEVPGPTITIPPNTSDFVWGNAVFQLAPHQIKQARGHLQERNWSTVTWAPRYP